MPSLRIVTYHNKLTMRQKQRQCGNYGQSKKVSPLLWHKLATQTNFPNHRCNRPHLVGLNRRSQRPIFHFSAHSLQPKHCQCHVPRESVPLLRAPAAALHTTAVLLPLPPPPPPRASHSAACCLWPRGLSAGWCQPRRAAPQNTG